MTFYCYVFRMSGLHQASLVGNTDIMKMLLEGGALVDCKDSKGKREGGGCRGGRRDGEWCEGDSGGEGGTG